MLWYDKSFCPDDIQHSEDKPKMSNGFGFKSEYFSDNDHGNVDDFDITLCSYLDEEDISRVPLIPNEPEFTDDRPYSAYDKIEKILYEAQKSNKDLFGEIINLTSSDDFTENNTEEPNTENYSDDLTKNNNDEDITASDKTCYTGPDTEIKFDSKYKNAVPIKSGKYFYYGTIDSEEKRTGKGRTITPEGITLYDGEYLYDKRDGFGVCYYKNGSINYVGNWTDNYRNGSGVGYRLSDGTMHAGKWANNSPDGYGARFDSEGNLIDVCEYENGVRCGKSISFDVDGNILVSIWDNGELVSEKIIEFGD